MHRLNVFIKNGIVLTSSSLIIKFIFMIFNIFLSNNIPSNILGVWSLIMSVFSFLMTIALSGINLAATRLTSEEKSHGLTSNIPCILKACMEYSFIFSIISIFLTILFSNFITQYILKNIVPIYLIFILALSLPLISLSSCLNGYFMAMKKVFVVAISQLIEISVQVLIVIFLLHINKSSNVVYFCLSLSVGLVISELASFIYLISAYCKYNKLFRVSTHKSYKKQVLKISLPVAITTYIKAGLSTIKNALIPIALTTYGLSYNSSLSYYGLISTTVMSLILFPYTLIQSYSSLLIPELSSYNKKTDEKKITHVAYKSIYATLIFSVLICIFFILFSDLINEKFYSSVQVALYIRILSPIIIYIYMDNVIDSILKSLDFQVFVMLINIIDLVASISFIKFLIPKFGISGYIFVLYFSEVFNFLLSFAALKFKLKRLKD